MKYNGVPSSCESFTYGEVEDYKVNIVASSGLEENLLEQVTLYPNPTQDNITLNFGAASSTIQRMELTTSVRYCSDFYKCHSGNLSKYHSQTVVFAIQYNFLNR